jgi:hypothetical protein
MKAQTWLCMIFLPEYFLSCKKCAVLGQIKINMYSDIQYVTYIQYSDIQYVIYIQYSDIQYVIYIQYSDIQYVIYIQYSDIQYVTYIQSHFPTVSTSCYSNITKLHYAQFEMWLLHLTH